MHQWCPVLDENMLPEGDNDLSQHARKYPLLTLCMWFLTTSLGITELYRAIKHIYVVLQTDFDIRVEVVQLGVLIAMYEVSHGMQAQADYTVSACAIMLQYLDSEMSQGQSDGQSHMLKRLKTSLLRLDRCVAFSSVPLNSLRVFTLTLFRVNHLLAPSHQQPMAMSPSHPIPTFLVQGLGPLPPIAEFEYASSPRTLFFRTLVSIVSGRVYAYIHAQSHGESTNETYDDVNGAIHDIIGMLDGGPPPDRYLQCASYPVLVW